MPSESLGDLVGTEGEECPRSARNRLDPHRGRRVSCGCLQNFAIQLMRLQDWQERLVNSSPGLRASPHPTPVLLCGSGNGPRALFSGCSSVKLVRSHEAKWKREPGNQRDSGHHSSLCLFLTLAVSTASETY